MNTPSPFVPPAFEAVDSPLSRAEGETIATRYMLRRRLGEGGSGLVFEAEDLHTGRAVAVKFHMGSPWDVARFNREHALLRGIRIPGVLRVLDMGEHDAFPFIVMDLIRGVSVSRWLKESPSPMELGRVVRITAGLARVLALLHGSGIVHRDVKPANVVLDATTDRPWLVDFGLAVADESERLTSARTALGTPTYMAPERFVRGARPHRGWDLFSLGVLLFELAVGRPPFVARTFASQYELVRGSARPRMAEPGRPVPAALEAIFQRLCAVRASERPAAHIVAAELERIRADIETDVRGVRAQPDPATSLVTGFEGLHFLLVDDDPGDRRLLRAAMTRMGLGLQCIEARNGREAIEILRGLRSGLPEPPWVVITDLAMPGMDGNELIHEIQADPVLAPTPIVVASSCVECGHILDASPFEVEAIVSKSDLVRQLLMALAPLGGRRRAGSRGTSAPNG